MVSKVTFVPRIDKLLVRSFELSGFILCVSTPFTNPSPYKLLINSHVRSGLEFASSVQNVYQYAHQNKLKKKQRKFVKAQMHRNPKDYESTLKTYDIISLQHRRTLFDLTYLHKIMRNFVNVSLLLENIIFFGYHERMKERNVKKFAFQFSKTCYGSNSFSKIICSLYNIKFYGIETFGPCGN